MGKVDWNAYLPSPQQQKQLDALIALVLACHERDLLLSVVGGYGLDALFGKLTRDHHDFDIVIKSEDEPKFSELLLELGYRHVPEWSEPGRKEVYRLESLGDDFVLELVAVDETRLSAAAAQFGITIDLTTLFPKKPNGWLSGCTFRVPTVEGVELINQIQRLTGLERGWDEFVHREHQEALLAYLRECV